jgi:hypothetical protein
MTARVTATKRSRFGTLLTIASMALFAAPVLTSAPRDARAGDETIDYVECRWTPFAEAWACALAPAFTQGRFGAPPEFKHDALSLELRRRAWANAKDAPGARTRGRVGVFVPNKDGSWLFVPGVAWSPGEIVFLPPAAKGKG